MADCNETPETWIPAGCSADDACVAWVSDELWQAEGKGARAPYMSSPWRVCRGSCGLAMRIALPVSLLSHRLSQLCSESSDSSPCDVSTSSSMAKVTCSGKGWAHLEEEEEAAACLGRLVKGAKLQRPEDGEPFFRGSSMVAIGKSRFALLLFLSLT